MAEPFMLFVYGEKWLPSADPAAHRLARRPVDLHRPPRGAVLAAMNRLGREVWIHIAQGVPVSVACYYGLKHWGISGAAWGVFAGIAFSTPVMISSPRAASRAASATWDARRPGVGLNLILLAVLALAGCGIAGGLARTSAQRCTC